MRVLVATVSNDRSEVAIYKGMIAAGIGIDMLCDPLAAGQEELSAAGVAITQLAVRHRLDLAASRAIRRQAAARKYDVIYAPRNKTLSAALLGTRGIDARLVAYRGTMGHLSRWDPAAWLTYLNPRVDRIICVSEAVRQFLLSMRLPPSRLVTIHKGHDVAWYEGAAAPDPAEFGVPVGAFVVGFTGSMRPVKGVDVLIRSAHYLKDLPWVHFLLVGDVRDTKIRRLAADQAIRHMIHFAGFRKDAPAMASTFNVFVMPSVEREGLPRALIEAMAVGVPGIVSNVGGMPEIVRHGQDGLVVPPRDPRALAAAIACLARDPGRCKTLGAGARERIGTDFNIRTTIRLTVRLFEELAQAGVSGSGPA